MAYIVFGPPGLRAAPASVRAEEDRPFGFQASGSAAEVVDQLIAGGGRFAAVEQVVSGDETRQVYVWAPSVLWVEDD